MRMRQYHCRSSTEGNDIDGYGDDNGDDGGGDGGGDGDHTDHGGCKGSHYLFGDYMACLRPQFFGRPKSSTLDKAL